MNAPSCGIGGIAMCGPGQQDNQEMKMRTAIIIILALAAWGLAMQTMKPTTQAIEGCMAKTHMTAGQCEFELTR